MIDSEQWTNNVTVLNKEIVDWMGYSRECYFTKLLEYNTRDEGYGNGLTKEEAKDYRGGDDDGGGGAEIMVDYNNCRRTRRLL